MTQAPLNAGFVSVVTAKQIDILLDLLRATEALAETRVVERDESGWYGASASEVKRSQYCKECFRAGLHGAPIEHAASCAVGQALFAVALVREELAGARAPRVATPAGTAVAAAAEDAPVFSETETDAWKLTRKYAAEVARNHAPAGILRPVPVPPEEAQPERFAESPVRQIVYDVTGVDLGCEPAGVGLTHEEAAARAMEAAQ